MIFKIAVIITSSDADDQFELSHDDPSTCTVVRDVVEAKGAGNFAVLEPMNVPLDPEKISELLTNYSSRVEVDVILVIGGIGVGRGECTPEVRYNHFR